MNSEGGKPGNVLTVNGNYTGNNGLMTFNATLGGDNSPTDKMNVKGDTQGNTRVRVDNIGGVGAQTVNGIELIEVGGNSAGNFHESDGGPGIARIMAFLMRQLIWGLVVINEHDNHDRQRLDSSLVYVGAHNVYYVKCDLSDAKRFSGRRYYFRVPEHKASPLS